MNQLLFLIKYRLLLVAGILLFLFFSLLLFTIFRFRSSPKQETAVYPTSIPEQRSISKTFISPLQVTEVGKPLTKEPDMSDTIQDKKTQADGSTVYTFPSPVSVRSDQVITNNENIVTFERILTPEYKDEIGYATISEYLTRFGTPEKIIRGSKFYGWYVQTYIYASSGFTFIGNPNTDEIYEFHKYIPMSVESYTQKYGEDLNPGALPAGE